MNAMKYSLITVFICCLVSVPVYAGSGSGIHLEKPVVTAGVKSAFPENDAGLCAYMNFQSFDDKQFTSLKNSLKITEEGTGFAIGSIGPSTYEYPYVFINKDGWIVVYLMKDVVMSRIMDRGSIKLLTYLNTLCNTANLPYSPSSAPIVVSY